MGVKKKPKKQPSSSGEAWSWQNRFVYGSEEEEMRKEKKGNTNHGVIWSFLSPKQKVRVIQADAPRVSGLLLFVILRMVSGRK